MARSWRPGEPGFAEAEARWRQQHGHPPADKAHGSPGTTAGVSGTTGHGGPRASFKARPSWWPTPHPAVVAAEVEEAYRDIAAAVPLAGTTGQLGGCGHCTPCQVGAPQRCHNPDSPAGRRNDAELARALGDQEYDRARARVEWGLLQLPPP